MEVLAAVFSSILAEPCRVLFTSIQVKIKNFFNFRAFLDHLDRKMKDLNERRDDVKRELEVANKNGLVPTAHVKDWQRKVAKIVDEVNALKEEIQGNTNNSVRCCYFSCCNKEQLRNAALEKLADVQRLIEASSFPSGVAAANQFPAIVEHVPGPPIEDNSTVARNISKVIGLLSNDEVKRIGIWGMGGVGKTTLVRNVNNMLANAPPPMDQHFSIVIWITVSNRSKESDLRRVQGQIADRLKMTNEGSLERMAIQLHDRLKKENFLLILDDVWYPIDLDIVGVPRPEIHEGSKILMTTRFSEVCEAMITDEILKVEVLNEEEGWWLFCKKAGELATSERVRPLAEAITRECCGLPLAINIVGASMRGKKMVEQWEDALDSLRRSEPIITGIEDGVFRHLKLSYDSLPNKCIKSCFLFCCLYPEDCLIPVDELVSYWFAEGLIDEGQSLDKIRSRGITIIERLKAFCLLDEGYRKETVKMHDIVRDVAVWIATLLEEECKSVVKSGTGLMGITEENILKSARRFSFMSNNICVLPKAMPQSPLETTLLLQGNPSLKHIPDTFLPAFPSLKLLDLSDCRISSLPVSLEQLVELRALILARCVDLTKLPPVGGLSKLQVLDCSYTSMKRLPEGMTRLTNLRQLDLSYISSSTTISAGAIAGLSMLETLNMSRDTGEWLMEEKYGEEGRLSLLEEIIPLEHLTFWAIDLESFPVNIPPTDALINRINKLKKFLAKEEIRDISIDNKRVILNCIVFSEEWTGWFFLNATSMHFRSCEELSLMLEKTVINSDAFGSFDMLRMLEIEDSDIRFQRKSSYDRQLDILPNLEILHLRVLTRLTSIAQLAEYLGLQFSRLKCIRIEHCPQLKYLLSVGASVVQLGQLEEITVDSCNKLKELFRYDFSNPSRALAPDALFPKVRILRLKTLPTLQNFCSQGEITCPKLEEVEVTDCHVLKSLPVTVQNATTIKEIKGQYQWWHQLNWDDKKIKPSLQNFFRSVSIFDKYESDSDDD